MLGSKVEEGFEADHITTLHQHIREILLLFKQQTRAPAHQGGSFVPLAGQRLALCVLGPKFQSQGLQLSLHGCRHSALLGCLLPGHRGCCAGPAWQSLHDICTWSCRLHADQTGAAAGILCILLTAAAGTLYCIWGGLLQGSACRPCGPSWT